MPLRRPTSKAARWRALFPAVLLGACAPTQAGDEGGPRPALGLFTTLPLYWGEGDVADLIEDDGERDWVREELEKRFELVPLDTLEPETLRGLDRVILAQPRPLAPSENVSLDQWVAEGGTAVILADPLLTRHSDYPLGDRRRPQDTVLLSPILARWGLELTFDPNQPGGEREIADGDEVFPINMAGRFAPGDGNGVARCTIGKEAVFAQCRRGAGMVFLFADAAVLDWPRDAPVPERRKRAIDLLTKPMAR